MPKAESQIDTKYTYKVEIISYINGEYNTMLVSQGTRDSGYEITLYKDRNNSYFGNNAVILALRSLYSNEVKVYNFTSDGVDASEANVRIAMHGYGDRMIIYSAEYEEEVVALRDYLVEGSYTLNNGSVEVGAGKTITLSDKLGSALYSNYNDFKFNFTLDSASVTAGDEVRINLAMSEVDGSGNGAYLIYNPVNGTLSFQFYYGGAMHSLAQVFELGGVASDSHELSVKFNKSLVASSLSNYVGGDKVANLTYNGVELTDTKGVNKVHYQEVVVTMDGESTTFYMPLFNDMGLWKRDNGQTFGNANAYSNATLGAPTFLALYNYSSVVAPASVGIKVDGYATTNGEYNGFISKSVVGTPII